MKKNYFNLLLLFISISVFAQQPYYNGIDFTLTGIPLKNALATKIINTHTNQLSYSQIWNACQITDLDPNNSANVLLIYGWENGTDADVTNDLSRSKTNNGGGTGQWNREHVYAKSLGTPNLGTSGPGADAHHLRSADVQRNGTRSSLKFITGSGNSGIVGSGWYPGDQWKGDVARMIMYMWLRYGNRCLPSNVAFGTANSVEPEMINLLLDWNAADPPSSYEDARNTYHDGTGTYAQGNRNPFIDEPYLATLIWGGTPAQDRWGLAAPDTQAPTVPTNLAVSNPTSTTMDLTWTASTDNIGVTAYDIYVDGVYNATSTTNSITITGLTASTTYSFTVLAKDAAGNTSAQSAAVNGTTTAPDTIAPTVPTNLVTSNPSSTTMDLTWTASTDNVGVTAYDIYVDGVYNATSTTNSITITGLTASTTYSFTVLAKDAAGNTSAQSAPVNGTTTAASTYCANETFENIPANNSSYTLRTWTGNDGIANGWTATNARTDQTLTTRAITMRNGVLTSPSIGGGIGSLTVSTQRVFSGGAGVYELFVNGVSKGTVPYGTAVQTTTISNINTTGNISIEFRLGATGTTSDRVKFDDLNWACYTVLGVDSFELSKIKIYPNPATENTLNITTDRDLNVSVFDILGKQILKDNVSNNNTNIDISSLNSGIYFVKLSSDEGTITRKFIKK